MVRSSGPRTARTMQNSLAPSAAVSARGAQHLVGVEERAWPSPGCRSATTGRRSGSPRGSPPVLADRIPSTSTVGPAPGQAHLVGQRGQRHHRLVGHDGQARPAPRRSSGRRSSSRATPAAAIAPARLGLRRARRPRVTGQGSTGARRVTVVRVGARGASPGMAGTVAGALARGGNRAWRGTSRPNRSTRPSWPGPGPSSTRRSSPSRPSTSTPRLLGRAIRPLQEEVKRQGLWAAHLPPELGGMGFGQVRLGLLHEVLGPLLARPRWSSATTPRTRATPSCWPWGSSSPGARTSAASGSSRCSRGSCAAPSP